MRLTAALGLLASTPIAAALGTYLALLAAISSLNVAQEYFDVLPPLSPQIPHCELLTALDVGTMPCSLSLYCRPPHWRRKHTSRHNASTPSYNTQRPTMCRLALLQIHTWRCGTLLANAGLPTKYIGTICWYMLVVVPCFLNGHYETPPWVPLLA